MRIAIVKYNAGNIYSVVHALKRLGIEPILTDEAEVLAKADRVLFPGQGEATTAMTYLRQHGLDRVIRDLRQPVLGICIGQHLLCNHSEEGNTDCLGIIPMEVKRFVPECSTQKVPQMGWNSIHNLRTPLFKSIDESSYIYNIHSYYVPYSPDYTIATCNYILPYSAALHKDNFYATQFHPEKSGSVGEQVLKNFIELY